MDAKLAKKIIAKIKTAEQAAELVGSERAQYLKALDKVYGSREKRAADMGFNPETYYHGSFRNIKEFKPEKASPEGYLGKSIYLTSDPVDASKNYARATGPDVDIKIASMAEKLEREKDMNWDDALELAKKRIVGRVESGAVYPVRTRAQNVADIGSHSQYLNLEPDVTEADEVVENPLMTKIMEGLSKRGAETENRIAAQKIASQIDPFETSTPKRLVDQIKAGSGYVTDQEGRYIEHELARGALEDAGYDAASLRPNETFGSWASQDPKAKHLMVFDPAKIRSTNAAFDPRFKESKNLLAAVGEAPTKAGQILAKALPRTNMGLTSAFNIIDEAMEPLRAPREKAIKLAAKALGKSMDISGGKVPGMAEDNASILETIGQFVVPGPEDFLLGGAGKLMRVGKAASIAEKAAAKLEQAMASGYKPTAAEALSLSKFRNKPTVLPTAQEIVERSMKRQPAAVENMPAVVPEAGVAISHYGKPGLEVIDPAFAGKGVDERKFMRTGLPNTKTAHFYGADEMNPEALVTQAGQQKYVGTLGGKLYDFKADPENYMKKAREAFVAGTYGGKAVDPTDLAKEMAKEAGYSGLSWDMGTGQKIYESFGPVPVKPVDAKGLFEASPIAAPVKAGAD